MCAWHQAPLRGWWDLFPCTFAWPWYRLILNLNLAEPSWEEEAQETAASTKHLLACHWVSMALPSHLSLKLSQWLSSGKRASQWDLGGKLNSWHSLLSTSSAITEPFSFSFSFTLTLLQNSWCGFQCFHLCLLFNVCSNMQQPTCTTTGAPLQENFGPRDKLKPQLLIQPVQYRETVPCLAFTWCVWFKFDNCVVFFLLWSQVCMCKSCVTRCFLMLFQNHIRAWGCTLTCSLL